MKRIWLNLCAVFLAGTFDTWASVWDLSDQNSFASFSTSISFMHYSWLIDGSEAGGSTLFYAQGSGGDRRLGSLSLLSEEKPDNQHLVLQYSTQTGAVVTVSYALTGGPSGVYTSDLSTTVSVSNTLPASLDFTIFWQYSAELDRVGTGDDTAEIDPITKIGYASDSVAFAVTVPVLIPDHYEVRSGNFYPDLNDDIPTTLNDSDGPVGPGDPSIGYQWNMTLGLGESQQLTIKQHIGVVPEPSTWLLLISGGWCVFMRRKCQRRCGGRSAGFCKRERRPMIGRR